MLHELEPDIAVRAVYGEGNFLVLRYPGDTSRLTMFMDDLCSGDIDALAAWAVQELSEE